MSAERKITASYDSAAIAGAKAPAANMDHQGHNGGSERRASISGNPWKEAVATAQTKGRVTRPGDLFEGHVPLANDAKLQKPKKIPTW